MPCLYKSFLTYVISLYDDITGVNIASPQRQKVVCTQPHRVAAMEVAGRLASELNVKLGEEVGYHLGHENISDTRTRRTTGAPGGGPLIRA